MTQPDNFSLYQPLVIGALWMGARGLRGLAAGRSRWPGSSSASPPCPATTACSSWGRSGLAFLWDRWRAWRSSGGRAPAIPFGAAVACVALFVLVMAPWWARQLAVFGSLSPSTASGKVLFIRDIEEWNSITTPATLDYLLGQGARSAPRRGSAAWSPRS